MDNSVRILLAEDNEINREVVLDFLEPLGIDTDTAADGLEALEKLKTEKYDFVFMDYLMPKMNGDEVTRIFRKDYEGKVSNPLPIVALTASDDEVGLLLSSGMNDYLIKPVTLDSIVEILNLWIPEEFSAAYNVNRAKGQDDCIIIPPIEGIDIAAGVAHSGSKKLLKKLFSDYAKVIDSKCSKIRFYISEEKYSDARIEIHALKSSSNLIGAVSLSRRFKELEDYIRLNQTVALKSKIEDVLSEYEAFKGKLSDEKTGTRTFEVSDSTIECLLLQISRDAGTFYIDGIDGAIKELKKCKMSDELTKDLKELETHVADVALDDIIVITEAMLRKVRK